MRHLLLPVVALAGCVELHASSVIETRDLTPQVEADFDGKRIEVRLRIPYDDATEAPLDLDQDYVMLSDGDEFRAEWWDKSKRLHNGLFTLSKYRTRLRRHDPDGEAWLSLPFHRSTDLSATESACLFPPRSELLEPRGNGLFSKDRYSRGKDAIAVRWEAQDVADIVTRLELRSLCGDVVVVELDGDPGAYTFPAGAWDTDASGDFATWGLGDTGDTGYPGYDEAASGDGSCRATLTLVRSNPGWLDPKFGGGSFACRSAGSVNITIDP